MKQKTDPMVKKKPMRYLFWLILVIIIASTVIFGHNSFLKIFLSYREVAKLEEKVNTLKAENDRLTKENHELKTNPDVIEKIAREELGYQKSGEKVYRFIPSQVDDKNGKKKD